MKLKPLDSFFSKKVLQNIALSTAILSLTACGGSSSGSGNQAPTAGSNKVTVQAGQTTTYSVIAKDAEEDPLTYSIKTAPSHGTASIDEKGTITYQATNYIGSDTIVVSVSDGTNTTDVSVEITLQAEAAFDYQFYKVSNPNKPGSYQIVRYDPNDNDANTNQVVVKDDVLLSNKVFVLSGAKSEDSTVYLKREYGVFLDQGASNETRQTEPTDGSAPTEYTFYTDSILKRFDARNTNLEYTIFQSFMLPNEIKSQGVSVISANFELHTTEADIDNSYVQLKAFDELPDAMKSETESSKKQLPLIVRITDSKAVAGRMISTILDHNGTVQNVLLNELTAYTGEATSATTKSLKLCDAALTTCNTLANTDGSYHYLAKNDSTVYMAKEGDNKIYAFTAADSSVAAVSGVTYPAAYDALHHQIAFNGGHGGSGIFSNFYNMPGVVDSLAEGDTSYLLINYNLDTQDKLGDGQFSGYGSHPYAHKNAMILKLAGTSGTKVYDNGTGEDLKNDSDAVTPSYNLSLTAAKDGHLFIEAAKFNGSTTKNFNYQVGWLDTSSGTQKTELDNAIISKDIPYFTGVRVPPIAVGEHVYVNEDTYTEGNTSGSANRIYNIYKMPINTPAALKESAEHVTGRMYFERSAYRSSGIYDGNVLLWDRHNKGTITNATTGETMGIATELEAGITNVMADSNGNGTLAGVGGLFGLHMTASHGSTPVLASGVATQANSLKVANKISGSWIID